MTILLPPGAKIRGTLYDDPEAEYLTGDVLEVELGNEFFIDVAWEYVRSEAPFLVTVYQTYYGHQLSQTCVRTPEQVVRLVQALANIFARWYTP